MSGSLSDVISARFSCSFIRFLVLGLCLWVLGGCAESETLDQPVDKESPRATYHPVDGSGVASTQGSSVKQGIFKIVPPAHINPRNLERPPDPQIITIDFQSGFKGYTTVVTVDGKVIFRDRLNSGPTGYADFVSFRYDEPPARFTLELPDYGVKETFSVDPDQGRFLGISIVDGQIKLKLQPGPFFYGQKDDAP